MLLFGKVWARELGFPDGGEPQGAALFKAPRLTALGALLTAALLHNTIAVWLPATWGVSAPAPSLMAHAAPAAFFTGLRFVLPVLLRGMAWERKSWRLLGIDAGYQMLAVAVVACIIVMR